MLSGRISVREFARVNLGLVFLPAIGGFTSIFVVRIKLAVLAMASSSAEKLSGGPQRANPDHGFDARSRQL
jgi:hypothetical protein